MSAAVLSIGTEITRGEIVNTNATWICDALTALGFEVTEIASVDDDRDRICQTLVRLGAAHDLIICSGGLGPTTDDLTTECVSMVTGCPMVRDPATVQVLYERFRKIGRPVSASNLKQADFPSGATVLSNAAGTAPGFSITIGRALTFFFPGVPLELERIWKDHVEAVLRTMAPRQMYQIRLRTYGMGESAVGELLSGVEQAFPWLTIGYRASFPEVEVKVLARGSSLDQARSRAETATAVVRERLGKIVYSQGSTTMVGTVAQAMRTRGATLALAESCTGGLVAQLLTSEPASDYFSGGVVTYSNEAKTALLGVPAALIEANGAVSEEVAVAMAQGVRRVTGASFGVALTGIAGPTGGTAEKPVGLVHWAVAHEGGVEARNKVFWGDRRKIQRNAAFAALDLLRRVCAP